MALVDYTAKDHLGTITLNRPDALNAVSGAFADEIAVAFERAAADNDVWVVVLRAEGDKAFCVGADLKERQSFGLSDYHANRVPMTRMFAALRRLPQPSIAAIFGFALGGGFELALSCDLIVAAEGTQMGLPEARVGLLPAGGGTQLLTRRVGIERAKELVFTGRRMDAAEALAVGVVSKVVRREELDATATSLAKEILESSPVSVRGAKASIDAALGLPLEAGVNAEHEVWKLVVASEDRSEGVAAFNERRAPRWGNR